MRLAVFAVIGLAVLGLVAVLAWGLTRKEPVTGLSGETRVGLPAPHFTIELLDGGEMALSELSGPVVVNFWASWCARACGRKLGGSWVEPLAWSALGAGSCPKA